MKKERFPLFGSNGGGRRQDITSTRVRDGESIGPVEQEALQGDWESLDAEQKAVLRAQRARRGERCSSCGCVGYFRRNCPTCPPVRYDVKTGEWRRREVVYENDSSITDQALPPGQNRHGKGEEVRGRPGRGFLWGSLAREVTQGCNRDDSETGNRIPPGTAKSCSGPRAMVLEIPSLVGSSNLSSGVISGLRKALASTDVDERTKFRSISFRGEANDKSMIGSSNITYDSTGESGQDQGGDEGPVKIDPQLAWRWRDFSSTPTKTGDSIVPSQGNEGVLGENNPRHPPRIPGNSGTRNLPSAPIGSYLRLRNKMVLAVEENLHLALIRLLEAARQQASTVVSKPFAAEILQEPTGVPLSGPVMPTSTCKAYRDLFDEEDDKVNTMQQPKVHTYLGSLREEGKLKYVFDRTSHNRRGSLAAHLRGDFRPRRRGYRGTAVHSVTAWRRPNTLLDRHATSGKDKITRIARSEEAFRHQTVWVEHHKRAREQRREKSNRLLKVLRSELEKEQMREIEVIRHSGRDKWRYLSQATIDRVVTADRIVRTIKRYGLMSNTEDAHYILYALNAARRAGMAPERTSLVGSKFSAGGNTVADSNAPRKIDELGGNASERGGEHSRYHVPSPGAIPPNHCAAAAGTAKGVDRQRKRDASDGSSWRVGSKPREATKSPTCPQLNDDDEISPYVLPLARTAAITKLSTKKSARVWRGVNASRASRDKQSKESLAAKKVNSLRLQSERLRGFHLTGQNIRKALDDDTTAVPAIIPLPKAFGSGKISELEKVSFAAGTILDSLQRGQVNPITGRTTKVTAPLWHRATGEIDHTRAGSILYSDLIGHTYSVLLGPKLKSWR